MSGYVTTNTGLSGTMSIEDDDHTVGLTFKALTPVGVPVTVSYTYTIDGVESSVQTFSYVNNYSGTDARLATRMLVRSLEFTNGSNLSWLIQANTNPEIGGPTSLNLFIIRSLPILTYIAWVRVSGIWKQAVPYVKVAGVWKKAAPWIYYGGWTRTR